MVQRVLEENTNGYLGKLPVHGCGPGARGCRAITCDMRWPLL
jgi:hypothetical protein